MEYRKNKWISVKSNEGMQIFTNLPRHWHCVQKALLHCGHNSVQPLCFLADHCLSSWKTSGFTCPPVIIRESALCLCHGLERVRGKRVSDRSLKMLCKYISLFSGLFKGNNHLFLFKFPTLSAHNITIKLWETEQLKTTHSKWPLMSQKPLKAVIRGQCDAGA